MSKKRAIIATAAATLAIGAAAGTYAAFSDSAESDPAQATAGTLFLDGGIVQDGTWTLTGLAPNQVTASKSFTVKNGGSLSGQLDLTLTATGAADVESTTKNLEATAENGAVTPASELPKNLTAKISYTPAGGATAWLLGGVDSYEPLTPNGDNIATFATIGRDLAPSAEGTIEVTFKVADAGNELQGDGAEIKLAAALRQS